MNNKLPIILILFCFLCSGCKAGRHIATVEIFNAQGESTGKAVLDLPRPMMVEYKDAKADSRGVSGLGEFWKGLTTLIAQIFTLGIIAD